MSFHLRCVFKSFRTFCLDHFSISAAASIERELYRLAESPFHETDDPVSCIFCVPYVCCVWRALRLVCFWVECLFERLVGSLGHLSLP